MQKSVNFVDALVVDFKKYWADGNIEWNKATSQLLASQYLDEGDVLKLQKVLEVKDVEPNVKLMTVSNPLASSTLPHVKTTKNAPNIKFVKENLQALTSQFFENDFDLQIHLEQESYRINEEYLKEIGD